MFLRGGVTRCLPLVLAAVAIGDYNQRAHMEAIIKGERSVLHQGRIISRVEDLPSEADLAAGDPVKEADARARLQGEVARLQTELAKLTATPAPEDARDSSVVEMETLDRNALKTLARERGIQFTGSATREELLARLQEAPDSTDASATAAGATAAGAREG